MCKAWRYAFHLDVCSHYDIIILGIGMHATFKSFNHARSANRAKVGCELETGTTISWAISLTGINAV